MAEPHSSDRDRTGSNRHDLTEAAAGAEQLISRMQDIVTEAIQPDGDPEEAFEDLIEELDPAPEGQDLREALGMPREGSRSIPGGSGETERVKAERPQEQPAKPEDTPPEYRTWETGP